MSRQARSRIKRIPFVRPPAINAHREILAMCVPVATHIFFIESGKIAGILHGSTQGACQYDRVQYHTEVHAMKLIEYLSRLGKHARIELERAVFSIPS